MKEYKFTGVLSDMHQRAKKTKNVGWPHTMFSVAVDPVQQTIFEEIIERMVSSGHHVEVIVRFAEPIINKTNTVSVESSP